MSEQFVQGYFEQLAALHPDIAHSSEKPAFFRIQEEYNLDEFDRAVRATKSRTVLLLEFGEGDIAEGDANYDQAAVALCLLTKISSEKFEDIRAAKAAMKTLALDFIGRLREDCRGRFERPDGADGPLLTEKVRFDGRVHYADIGPIDRLWYGKRISFVFRAPIALPYNPSRWT